MSHGWRKAMAAIAMVTTPVATVRAATSLTGLGKLKIGRLMPPIVRVRHQKSSSWVMFRQRQGGWSARRLYAIQLEEPGSAAGADRPLGRPGTWLLVRLFAGGRPTARSIHLRWVTWAVNAP